MKEQCDESKHLPTRKVRSQSAYCYSYVVLLRTSRAFDQAIAQFSRHPVHSKQFTRRSARYLNLSSVLLYRNSVIFQSDSPTVPLSLTIIRVMSDSYSLHVFEVHIATSTPQKH